MHHTWAPNHSHFTGSNHRAMQDSMKDYQVKTNGWSDIAQHLTIYPDGKVMTGRNINRAPASATNYNGSDPKHPFMFEMIGNFDKGHDTLQGKQLESVLEICRHFGNIVFHRECLINGKEPKSCPGTGIDKELFVKMVNQPQEQKKEDKEEIEVIELKKQVDKLSRDVGELTALIPAPKWFIDEFGSGDLGGLINDPKFTHEGWRTLAVALRAQKKYSRVVI